MTALRRRIRIVAIAWLVCQVASLAAFVPEQCCVAHAAEAAAKEKAAACHETVPPPEPKEGNACPLHRGITPAHRSPSEGGHDCCTMRNTCNGPGSHLTTLFAYVGVIEKPSVVSIAVDSTINETPATPSVIQRLALPDAPPPKA